MDMFTWQPTYCVGVKIMDNQHKALIKMLNDLLIAVKEGNSNEVLLSTLESLANYTIKHFDTEEELMEEFSYPEIEQHKKKHAQLRNEVKDYIKRYQEGNESFSIEVVQYLNDWIRDHILGTDKKLGLYIRENDFTCS